MQELGMVKDAPLCRNTYRKCSEHVYQRGVGSTIRNCRK